MKINAQRVLYAAAALVAFGLLLAWSGLINVAASTGHWMITDRFLHWAMRNSVRAQAAMTVDEPAADDSGLISAAGHYALNCAPCHGAPGELRSTVMQAATPPPPELARTIAGYADREIFWIIKHGVKFTPMPAWPAQSRDDEVRRMTAFVRRLPVMTPAQYRTLAYGPGRITGGEALELEDALRDCERCHADGGRGESDIPVLAGQKPGYLRAALEAFAAGKRPSAIMTAAASRTDPVIMSALADHYSSEQGSGAGPGATPIASPTADERLAARIFSQGLPQLDLPACAKCHAGRNPRYPILAGQKPAYLAARLRRWRGDPAVVEARKTNLTMPMIARRIPESSIEPLAHYASRQATVYELSK